MAEPVRVCYENANGEFVLVTAASPLPVAGSGGVAGGVQGDTAHDAVDAGNPVKIGGRASAAVPTAVATGDRVQAWFGTNGQQIVALGDGNGPYGSNGLAADGNTPNGVGLDVFAPAVLFNGTTWDRQRGNHEATVLASAARTTTTNSADLVNHNACGVIVTIDVTAVTATPSVTFAIQYKDTLSGQYKQILISAAISTVSTTTLVVYPGVTAAANLAASHPLPRVWRVVATHGDADSITYSVSANYVGQ